MNKTQQTFLLITLAAIPAAHAGSITYDWSVTGSSYGNAAGTLTISTTAPLPESSTHLFPNGTGGYDYSITALTGTGTSGQLNGTSLALVYAEDAVNFSTSTDPTLPETVATFEFSAGSHDYFLNHEYGSLTKYNLYEVGVGNDAGPDTFSLSLPVAAPEPGQMLSGMVLAGMGGLSLLARRMRNGK